MPEKAFIFVLVKKLVVSILAVYYLAASIGVTIDMHYCMDRLVSWKVAAIQGDRSEVCGMEKTCKGRCCKDVHTTVKLDKDQKVSETVFHLIPLVGSVPLPLYSPLLPELMAVIDEPSPVSNAPPPGTHVPLYVSNRVFRV